METKRFYGTGDAKGFSRKNYFEAVLELLENGVIESVSPELVAEATRFELEKLAAAAEKRGGSTGEKKDRLQSDYANALRKVVYTVLSAEPLSSGQIAEKLTAKGILAPTGKPYVAGWISQVLKADGKAKVTNQVITRTDKNGLKHEENKDCFSL